MRVAYVLPAVGIPSGWRSLAFGIVSAMRKYVEPIVIAEASDSAVVRESFNDIPVRSVAATQTAWFRQPLGVPRLLATWSSLQMRPPADVDLVHSLEAYPAGLVGHWLARRVGVPHVITACGTYGALAATSLVDAPVYRRLLRRAATICPISQGTGDHIRASFADALNGTPIRTVVPGTDYCAHIPRPAYDRIPEVPQIISVGAVKPRKGFEVSLEAFCILKERIPTARYTIIGSLTDRTYVSKLMRFILERGLRDVHFTGAISEDELAGYYRAACVFLLTPQQVGLATEGFGLVYIEAGAYGVPVVGTRTGGVGDAVLEGRTGFLHDATDTRGIADSLARLLTDRCLARRMGAENRAWAEQLTWDKCAAAYADIYHAVLTCEDAYVAAIPTT